MTATGRPGAARWKAAGLGVAAVGACAVCCAGPILSVLGGLTAAFAVGAVWVPALAVVALVAAVALGWTLRHRRSAPASCPVTLFTVLHRRATVARPGMTPCPCLSHDPGGGVAGCGGVDGPLIGTRPTEIG